jgi:hypothetical protein
MEHNRNDNAEKTSFSHRQAFSPIDLSWEVAAEEMTAFVKVCGCRPHD